MRLEAFLLVRGPNDVWRTGMSWYTNGQLLLISHFPRRRNTSLTMAATPSDCARSGGWTETSVRIHYIYKDSICANVILEIYKSLPKEEFYADCTCMKFDTRTAIFFYGKPYTGQLRKRDRATGEILDTETVTFYDERE